LSKSRAVKGSLRRRKIIKNTIKYIILIFLAYIFLFPTAFMIISSLKQDEMQIIRDMSSYKAFIPYGSLGFQNYKDVFERMNFGRFFFNSVFVTGVTIVIGVIINSMIAFALARLQFKGRKFLVALIIALLIVPIESIVIPMLLLVNNFGILDSYTVQIIPFIADAFIIFLFYQSFSDLPKSLDEAAIVDGASYFRIYWNIAMPLSKPIIVTSLILNFLSRWGDLLWPIMVTRGETYRPLPVAMQQLFTLEPKMWGDIFAFATMVTLPILILFLLFQKQFIKSIASTGIKG
jgi:multiple sugar transport system permease protein